ncbi:gamma-glutamyl kinase [Paracoccaceae bacterium]|nr:gamma-glutamyl kinase [Paracoccaceae bacterium]
MLIFWKQNLAFLAVPKTGTSAYAQALGPIASLSIQDPPELKHAPLIRYNRFIRPMYDIVYNTQLDTMAVIREPISWMGSWYRYRQRPFLKGKPTSTQDISFDTFVRGYLQSSPPAYAHIGSQARFITPRAGTPPVTYLFRYENQSRLREFLEHRLGTKIQIPRHNASSQTKLNLSACVEGDVIEKYQADFNLWHSLG